MIPSGSRRFRRAHADLRPPAHLPCFSSSKPSVRGPGATLGAAGAHRKCLFRILPFSVFRIALFNGPAASGHPFRHFELPSGRYLPKAGPVGPAQADYQTAETAVRSETVVGAGNIAFRRCRTGGGGFLDDRPIQSRGTHDGKLPRPPAKGGPDAGQRTRPRLTLRGDIGNRHDPGPRLHAPSNTSGDEQRAKLVGSIPGLASWTASTVRT